MISRIDHVSVAVKDKENAVRFFTEVLGARPGAGETDPKMKYSWRVFSIGDLSRFELLNPTEEGSFLENFLEKHPLGGAHHITMETPDIEEAAKTLAFHGIPYFGYSDKADAWKELFIHPKDAFGVLIQIAEFNPDDYVDASVKLPPGKKWEIENSEQGANLKFAHPGGGIMETSLSRAEIKALIDDLRRVVDG